MLCRHSMSMEDHGGIYSIIIFFRYGFSMFKSWFVMVCPYVSVSFAVLRYVRFFSEANDEQSNPIHFWGASKSGAFCEEYSFVEEGMVYRNDTGRFQERSLYMR